MAITREKLIIPLLSLFFFSATNLGFASIPTTESLKFSLPNGMEWQINHPKEIGSYDAIPISCILYNQNSKKITFEKRSESVVSLIIKNGLKQKNIQLNMDKVSAYGNYQPEHGNFALAYHFDLRDMIGKLTPGKYKLLIRIDSSQYEIQELKTQKTHMESGEFEIIVSSKKPKANSPKEENLKMNVEKKKINEYSELFEIAQITNNTNSPIYFSAYGGFRNNWTDTISGTLSWEKWHPKEGFYSHIGGYCGTGLGVYELLPGNSVHMFLPQLRDDGYYRYSLTYWTNGKAPKKSYLTLYSDVIYVNRFSE